MLDIMKDIQDISKIKLNNLDFSINIKDSGESKYEYKLTIYLNKKKILEFNIDCNYVIPVLDGYDFDKKKELQQNMNVKLGVNSINPIKPLDKHTLSIMNNKGISDYINNYPLDYQYSDKSIVLNGGKWVNYASNIEFYIVITIYDEYMKKIINHHKKNYISIVKKIMNYCPNPNIYDNSIVLKFALNDELPNYTIIGHQLYGEDGIFGLKIDIENIENSTYTEYDDNDDDDIRGFLRIYKNFIHFNDEELLKNNICLIFSEILNYTISNSGLWSFRSSYIMLSESCNVSLKKEYNIIKYLFNDLIIKEICSYLYEELE